MFTVRQVFVQDQNVTTSKHFLVSVLGRECHLSDGPRVLSVAARVALNYTHRDTITQTIELN